MHASLWPPKELFANSEKAVTVLLAPAYGDAKESLRQEWRNGYQYIFEYRADMVAELVTWLKEYERSGGVAVRFMFSGAFDGDNAKLSRVLSIQVPLHEFSRGYAEFAGQCADVRTQ